jgi:hypothetical protein
LDKINISDFSRWILETIGGIAPPDVYFEVMQLLGEGKYI